MFVIDATKCDGCDECVDACPCEAIAPGPDGKARVIDPEVCAECAVCEEICPNSAISEIDSVRV